MNSDWKQVPLEKLKASSKNAIAMGPFGSRIKAENFVEEGIPVIKGGNLTGDFIVEDKFDFLTEEKADELKTSNAFRRDIIITHRGTIGQVGIIPDDSKFERYVISQSQLKVTLDQEKINPYFVYYFLRSPTGQHSLLMNASQVGVPAIAQASTSVKGIMIPCPEKDIQNKIVKIILDIDRKIHKNQQINQTLESIAQAIFKSWFVDFEPVKAKMEAIEAGEDSECVNRAAMRAISGKTDDELDKMQAEQPDDYAQLEGTAELFPAAMWDSELGEVPEGWEIGCVGDVTEKIFSGGTPNTKTESYWNGELNWFSSGETRNLVIINTEKKITEKGAKESSTKLATYGDILIASAGQGHTRGQASFCAIDTFINQSVVSIRAKDIRLCSWLFFNLSRRYEEMRSISDSHSSRGSLTTKLLSNLSIIIPPESLCSEYGKIADKSLINVVENIRQTETLSNIRDTLLPKLLSGELKVADTEVLVKE